MLESKIKVLVVDDHPLIRIGVMATINAQPDMVVIAEAGTGEDAIRIFRQCTPDLILMDLRLPRMSGVEAIREICRASPSVRVIVITTYEGDEDIHQAFQAGAVGYIIKGMSHEVLLDAIRKVRIGQQFLPSPMTRNRVEQGGEGELRPREREVLALIVKGESNKEIASKLGITEGTVKCHVSTILLRLGVSDRTQAAVIALQRGFVHL